MASHKPATEALWKEMAPTYGRILEHPFIAGLADGSLPKDIFAGYLIQDHFYLEEYARCWALLGARSAVIDDLVTFTAEIESSLANEQGSLNELLEAMGYSRDEMLAGTEPSPTRYPHLMLDKGRPVVCTPWHAAPEPDSPDASYARGPGASRAHCGTGCV